MFQWVLHLQLQTWLSTSKTTVSVAPGSSELFHSTFQLYDSTHSSSVYHQTTLNSCDRPLHTGQARKTAWVQPQTRLAKNWHMYVCVCVTVCILHSVSMLTLYETSHARKAVKCHVRFFSSCVKFSRDAQHKVVELGESFGLKALSNFWILSH